MHPTTDPAPNTPPDELTCTACGVMAPPILADAAWPHWRKAACAGCGRFLKFVSKYTPEEREERRQQFRAEAMAHKPPSQAQLHWLQALGHTGAAPATMADASQRIDALVRKGGE